MITEPFITNKIKIEANQAIVWDALTNPVQTRKYMFGCEAISDWKIGSALLWKGTVDNKEMVFVEGVILSLELNQSLSYTTIDPHANIDHLAENYLTVTYQLDDDNGDTILTVTQGNYLLVAEGERRFTEAYNNGQGWQPILDEIKKLAETNALNTQ